MKFASIEDIKQNLIQCCENFDAFHFLPYLLSPAVKVGFPNKVRFYSYLKYILKTAKVGSTGSLHLRIEKESWEEDEGMLAYNFYDEVHNYPQINLQVKETEDRIFIDLKPF